MKMKNKGESVEIIPGYIAYTDGSCVNTSPRHEGGSAYIIMKDNKIWLENSKGFLNTTSNRMEMLAIISVVNLIPECCSVLIHSDSQYSINVLSGKWKSQRKFGFGRIIQI